MRLDLLTNTTVNKMKSNMFQNFQTFAFRPAWAVGPAEDSFLASHMHSGRRGGPSRKAEKGWGEKPRRRRGGIKFILLGLIAERPQHGYELIKELEKRRGNFRRLSPGSVYPTLQMLEEGGYLTSEELEDKKVYTITESGQTLLREHQEQAGDNPSHTHSDVEQSMELIELRRSLTTLNAAVTQLAQNGNPEQVKQASDRLDQVKREIYALLAQE